jgi:predicted O-methyltransferase YrrM
VQWSYGINEMPTPTLESWWKSCKDPANVNPYPWLHPAAIAYLETLLHPDMVILEHGSGGSTLWFAERVAQVYSVEDQRPWYDAMLAIVPENVTMIFSQSGRDIPTYINRIDLLMIDGHPAEARPTWIYAAPKTVRKGGVVVLDNANHPSRLDARNVLDTVCAYGVNIHPLNWSRPSDTTFYFMP